MPNPDNVSHEGGDKQAEAGGGGRDRFLEQPILNSPYVRPERHWELDGDGQPTHRILDRRRPASLISAIPTAKVRRDRQGRRVEQAGLVLDEGEGLSTEDQQYQVARYINRERVDEWRLIPDPTNWRVTPETARLLQHWRSHAFSGIRPFCCQEHRQGQPVRDLRRGFPRPESGRIAVKVINHLGDEVMKVFPV